MIKFFICCVGKIKLKYITDAIYDYESRISKYANIEIVEFKEEKINDSNESSIKKAIDTESNNFIEYIKGVGKSQKRFFILLDINGKTFDTISLYEHYENLKNSGKTEFYFFIGGSYGVNEKLKKYVDYVFSFSKLTFPHMLFRVILLEQIYRILKIEKNEIYHK